jgi:histone deacetylase complex regulatory component SIN3
MLSIQKCPTDKIGIQLQYVEFLKLREKYKQQVLELNSLWTEKTFMLIKIDDLEERLLET